jgi:hypothetical protein
MFRQSKIKTINRPFGGMPVFTSTKDFDYIVKHATFAELQTGVRKQGHRIMVIRQEDLIITAESYGALLKNRTIVVVYDVAPDLFSG